MNTTATQSAQDLPMALNQLLSTNALNNKFEPIAILQTNPTIIQPKEDTAMKSSSNMAKNDEHPSLVCTEPMNIPIAPLGHSSEGDAINERLSVNTLGPQCSTDYHEESISMRKLSTISGMVQNVSSPYHSPLSQ